ncbi:unnamed protein product [Echinostoma caproni]|uniref:Uncharacterized protein n=1 Tax=Echinostoma caproni TaxID=27848 RepID=A0A3P8GP92_9TREM|nr:unnamed protein product [Echinostoma caproni]
MPKYKSLLGHLDDSPELHSAPKSTGMDDNRGQVDRHSSHSESKSEAGGKTRRLQWYPTRPLHRVIPRLHRAPHSESLALQLLQLPPSKRISARAAMRTPYFSAVLPTAQLACLPDTTSIFEIPTIRMISESSDKSQKGEYSRLFSRQYPRGSRRSRSQYDDFDDVERSHETKTEVDEDDEDVDGLDDENEDSTSLSQFVHAEVNESVHGEAHGRWHRAAPLRTDNRNVTKPVVPCSSSMTTSSDAPSSNTQPDYVTACTNNNQHNGTFQVCHNKALYHPWLMAECEATRNGHPRRLYASRAYESADAIIQAVPVESPKMPIRSRPSGAADSSEHVPVKFFPSSFDHAPVKSYKTQGSVKSAVSTVGDQSPSTSNGSTFHTVSNAPGPSPAHLTQSPSFHTVFGGTGCVGSGVGGGGGTESSGFTSPLSVQNPARIPPSTLLTAYHPYLYPTEYCFPYVPADISQMNASLFYAAASQVSSASGPSGPLIEERRTAAAAVAAAAAAAAASAAAAAAASLYHHPPNANPELIAPPLPSRCPLTTSCTSTASGATSATKPRGSETSQTTNAYPSTCAFGPTGYMCAYLMPSGTGTGAPHNSSYWPRTIVPPAYTNPDPRLCTMYQSMLSSGPPGTLMEMSATGESGDTLKRPVSNQPQGSTASPADHTSTQSSSGPSKAVRDQDGDTEQEQSRGITEPSVSSGPLSESATAIEKPTHPPSYQEVAQWMQSVAAHTHSIPHTSCYGTNSTFGGGTGGTADGSIPHWMVFLPYQPPGAVKQCTHKTSFILDWSATPKMHILTGPAQNQLFPGNAFIRYPVDATGDHHFCAEGLIDSRYRWPIGGLSRDNYPHGFIQHPADRSSMTYAYRPSPLARPDYRETTAKKRPASACNVQYPSSQMSYSSYGSIAGYSDQGVPEDVSPEHILSKSSGHMKSSVVMPPLPGWFPPDDVIPKLRVNRSLSFTSPEMLQLDPGTIPSKKVSSKLIPGPYQRLPRSHAYYPANHYCSLAAAAAAGYVPTSTVPSNTDSQEDPPGPSSDTVSPAMDSDSLPAPPPAFFCSHRGNSPTGDPQLEISSSKE